MAGNADPQNVRILTMNMCHKKGEELGMVVIWDKIGTELANAGLFNWEELKRANQKGVKDALTRVVCSNAMKGFLDELIEMLGIAEFKAAQVGPAAAGGKRASKTDRTYEAAPIVEPPAHDTIEVTRQFFVDHGIEGLPLGNGRMTSKQLTAVTDLAISEFIIKVGKTPYASLVPRLVERIAQQITQNVGRMPISARAGVEVVERSLTEFIRRKMGNVRQAMSAPLRADGKVRYGNIGNFSAADLEAPELAAIVGNGFGRAVEGQAAATAATAAEAAAAAAAAEGSVDGERDRRRGRRTSRGPTHPHPCNRPRNRPCHRPRHRPRHHLAASRRAFTEVGSLQAHRVMREAGTRARAHAHAHVPSVHRQPSLATFTRRVP